MSIAAYFTPNTLASRLTLRDGLGEGIRVEGPVLEGKMSVEEAQLRARIRGLSDDAKQRAMTNRCGAENKGFWVTPGPRP